MWIKIKRKWKKPSARFLKSNLFSLNFVANKPTKFILVGFILTKNPYNRFTLLPNLPCYETTPKHVRANKTKPAQQTT